MSIAIGERPSNPYYIDMTQHKYIRFSLQVVRIIKLFINLFYSYIGGWEFILVHKAFLSLCKYLSIYVNEYNIS